MGLQMSFDRPAVLLLLERRDIMQLRVNLETGDIKVEVDDNIHSNRVDYNWIKEVIWTMKSAMVTSRCMWYMVNLMDAYEADDTDKRIYWLEKYIKEAKKLERI